MQAEFKHVSAEQIRAAVQPRLGKGFFALDLDAVQKAVAALPWVESVEARKRWPDTLQLRVYERQPFARWNDKQLISRQGLVFDAPAPMADIGVLPDLRGPDARLAEVVSFYAETRKAFAGTQLQINGGGADRARQLERQRRERRADRDRRSRVTPGAGCVVSSMSTRS